jgi:hypothetical protein
MVGVVGIAAPAGAAGAAQIKDGSSFGCVYAYDASATNLFSVSCGVGRLHDVLTPNGRENETFTLDGVANPTGSAVHIDGLRCASQLTPRETNDVHETISASGAATMVCNF